MTKARTLADFNTTSINASVLTGTLPALNGSALTNLPAGSTSGTWTPAGNGITFTTASGRWVKIGNMVTVWFKVQFPTTSNSGDARITGLPQTVGDRNAWGVLGNQNNSSVSDITVSSDAGSTLINLRNLDGAEKTNANLSQMTIQGGVTYSIAT